MEKLTTNQVLVRRLRLRQFLGGGILPTVLRDSRPWGIPCGFALCIDDLLS